MLSAAQEYANAKSYKHYLNRLKDGGFRWRKEYVERLKTLHNAMAGSKLKYVHDDDYNTAWVDLVLFDKRGNEVARVTSNHVSGLGLTNDWFQEAK